MRLFAFDNQYQSINSQSDRKRSIPNTDSFASSPISWKVSSCVRQKNVSDAVRAWIIRSQGIGQIAMALANTEFNSQSTNAKTTESYGVCSTAQITRELNRHTFLVQFSDFHSKILCCVYFDISLMQI